MFLTFSPRRWHCNILLPLCRIYLFFFSIVIDVGYLHSSTWHRRDPQEKKVYLFFFFKCRTKRFSLTSFKTKSKICARSWKKKRDRERMSLLWRSWAGHRSRRPNDSVPATNHPILFVLPNAGGCGLVGHSIQGHLLLFVVFYFIILIFQTNEPTRRTAGPNAYTPPLRPLACCCFSYYVFFPFIRWKPARSAGPWCWRLYTHPLVLQQEERRWQLRSKATEDLLYSYFSSFISDSLWRRLVLTTSRESQLMTQSFFFSLSLGSRYFWNK